MRPLQIIRRFGEVLDLVEAICDRYKHTLAVFAVVVAGVGGVFAYFQLKESAKAATYSSQIDALQLLFPDVIVAESRVVFADGDLYFFVRFRNNGELHVAVSNDFAFVFSDCFGLRQTQRTFEGDIENPYEKYGTFGPGDEPEFRFILKDFDAMIAQIGPSNLGDYLEFRITLQTISYTPVQDHLPQLKNALPGIERYEMIDGRKVELPKFSYQESVSEFISVNFGHGGEIQEVNSIKSCSQLPKLLQEND